MLPAMNKTPALGLACVLTACALTLTARSSPAQTTRPGADSKPASTNAPGQQYPQVDSERHATFRVVAPNAQSVRVNLGGGTPLTRDDKGVWTGTTRPLDPGFHYYWLVIDGVNVADPCSDSFFGSSHMWSGIEIPEEGVDFYNAKDVPHGEVRIKPYYSNITKAWRRSFIYTPPGYD